MTKFDHSGNAAYTARFQYFGAVGLAAAVFFVLFVASALVNLWQYRRPPIVMVTRVDDAGRAEPIRFKSGEYTPREAEIVSRLNEWALCRFRLLKAGLGENAQNFNRNYFFLESRLARELMATDADVVTKIQAGTMAEQDVKINGITFRSFETKKELDGTVGTGECVIDMVKSYSSAPSEHWQLTAKYRVNPQAAALRSLKDPAFQLENPLGVTVIWFHEDRAFD